MHAVDPAFDNQIRARQLLAIDQLSPIFMFANVFLSGTLTLLLYGQHGDVLLPWFAVVCLLSSARLIAGSRALAAKPRFAGRRAARRSILEALLSGACIVSVPAWLLNETTGVSFSIVVCQLTGTFWGGALLLATNFPAALAFMGMTATIVEATLFTSGFHNEKAYLASLFLAGLLTALASVSRQSSLFRASAQQQIELEHQRQVIGLLLKDFEEQTSDWLWETDASARFRNTSARFAQVLGAPAAAIEGRSLAEILLDDRIAGNADAFAELHARVAAREPFRDLVIPLGVGGKAQWWSLTGRPIDEPATGFAGYRGVAADITVTRLAQARISHMAHHDALTDLPNRSFFYDMLARQLEGLENGTLAVLSLDLDGFKPINDQHGHPVGDALLIAVAERFRTSVPAGNLVARVGGDEFAILMPAAGRTSVEALCRQVLLALQQPFEVLGKTVTVGVSIGAALAPRDGGTAVELLKNSDAALYRAKVAGRGTLRFFSVEIEQARRRLVQDLREEQNEFVLDARR